MMGESPPLSSSLARALLGNALLDVDGWRGAPFPPRHGDEQLDRVPDRGADRLVLLRRGGPLVGQDEEVPALDARGREPLPVQKVWLEKPQLATKVRTPS